MAELYQGPRHRTIGHGNPMAVSCKFLFYYSKLIETKCYQQHNAENQIAYYKKFLLEFYVSLP